MVFSDETIAISSQFTYGLEKCYKNILKRLKKQWSYAVLNSYYYNFSFISLLIHHPSHRLHHRLALH